MDDNQKLSYLSNGSESLSIRVHSIGHEKCKSLHTWGPGIRNFYLLHHVVKGKGIYKVGNTCYEISAGCTFLIYPNTEILYRADEHDPWEYYWVGFGGNDAGAILLQTNFTSENPVLRFDPGDEFETLIMNIYQSKGNSSAAKIKMSGYLMLALSMLAQISDHPEHRQETSTQYIQKAKEYIAYNYSQELTVQGIADYVGISRSQLFRVFRAYYNISPEQFILEFRIQQACQLLKNTSLSIASVGYSVGFHDNLYFSKAFKKLKGISPRMYIQSICQKNALKKE